jgi:beta-galactosidase/beta-glucuronidase
VSGISNLVTRIEADQSILWSCFSLHGSAYTVNTNGVPEKGDIDNSSHNELPALSFQLKQDTAWAKAGHAVATAQFKVPFSTPAVTPINPGQMPSLSVGESGGSFTIDGSGFQIVFSRSTGTMSSFIYNGTQLLSEGSVPNFWRAPLDNDYGNGMREAI